MKYKTTGYPTLYYKWLIGDLDKPKKKKARTNDY
tara:strand:- start:250 stop:351 length:102 start_codon:yes stop_codon:yes gene_type:complete